MEQSTSTISFEQLRGEELRAAFEAFVNHQAVPGKPDGSPRETGSWGWNVDFPTDSISEYTNSKPDSVLFTVDVQFADTSTGVFSYDVLFQNQDESVLTIKHTMFGDFTAYDAARKRLDENIKDETIAGILSEFVRLQEAGEMTPIVYDGETVPEYAGVAVNGGQAASLAPARGRDIEHGAGTIAAAGAATIESIEPEKPLSGHALGRKFKDTVQTYANQLKGSDSDEIAAAGTWEVKLPPEMNPVDDATIIDSVTFAVINDIDPASGISTGRQWNSINFFSGEKAVISFVRTTDGGYFFVQEKGEQANQVDIEDEQVIVKLLADIESLQADGQMKQTAATA